MTKLLLLGRPGPVTLTVARSCHRHHIELHLLSTDLKLSSRQQRSVGVTSVEMFSPDLIGTAQGIDILVQHTRRLGANAVMAVSDRELVWLGEQRHVFEPACRVLVQTHESLWRILSKCDQLEIAKNVGLPILKTFLLMDPDDDVQIPDSAFPLALRPGREVDIQPSFKVCLINSRKELREFLGKFQFVRSPIIAQPFMELPNLIVHGVRSVDGSILASRCFFVPRKFEGVTLSLEPCPFPGRLEQTCQEFVAQAGITGCYHFEFLFSAKKQSAYFLEINVRMGGTTDKVMQFGFDEPSLLLQAYNVIPTVPFVAVKQRKRVVNKRALIKHILWAMKDKLTELDYPRISRYRHILYSCRDLVLAKDSVFDWRDLRGSLNFHLRKGNA